MKNKTIIIKSIVFIFIFICLWCFFSYFLIFKYNYDEFYTKRYSYYEKEDKNKIDVLYLGTSSIQDGINPNAVFLESGITSFNLGAQTTNPISIYYLFMYAIKFQTPKLIVLDLSGISDKRSPDDEQWEVGYRLFLDTFPDKDLKRKYFVDVIKRSNYKSGWLFPLLRYHDRWIYSRDNSISRYYSGYEKGVASYFTTKSQSWSENLVVNNKNKNNPQIEYYKRIVKECKKRNIKIQAVITPKKELDSNYLLSAKQFCEDNNIDLLKFEKLSEINEIGLDTQKDFMDIEHFNYWGVEKFSKYFANYIQQKYDLVDHRNDKNYDNWYENAIAYYEFIENQYKEYNKNPDKYIYYVH